MLPGMVVSGISPLPTSIVKQADASTTSTSVSAPAGILTGDLLVFANRAANASAGTPPTIVLPSGFTQVAETNDGSQRRLVVSYKVAVGTESGTTLTGMSSTSSQQIVLVTYRANYPARTATPNTWSAVSTSGNPGAQNVPSATGTVPLVVFGIYGSNGAINPRTMTPAKDGEVGPSTFLYQAWKIYNSSPADVSVDMDDEGDNFLASGYITLR